MSRKNDRVFKPVYSPDSDRLYRTLEDRKEAQRFYDSKEWLELRAWFLRINPLCADCEAPATEVHHLAERRDFPHLALDPTNLSSQCKVCHLKKRKKNSNQ